MTATKAILLCALMTLAIPGKNYGQADRQYIDSIQAYTRQIDSLIVEQSTDRVSETNINKIASNFAGLQNNVLCASAELYRGNKGKTLYRLSYADNCDSLVRLQDYYFRDNKIVFIRTVQSSEATRWIDQYYYNDIIINPGTEKTYISEGYNLLKKMRE